MYCELPPLKFKLHPTHRPSGEWKMHASLHRSDDLMRASLKDAPKTRTSWHYFVPWQWRRFPLPTQILQDSIFIKESNLTTMPKRVRIPVFSENAVDLFYYHDLNIQRQRECPASASKCHSTPRQCVSRSIPKSTPSSTPFPMHQHHSRQSNTLQPQTTSIPSIPCSADLTTVGSMFFPNQPSVNNKTY